MKAVEASKANDTRTADAPADASTAVGRAGVFSRWWRVLRPADEPRRGVVIILALAVLAIIALAALSYMTVVRSDRVSSVIVSERAAYDRQPAVVIDHIAGLLTADLFGQKIVTPDVPRTVFDGGVEYPNWPRPFEDGNQWDYPHADPWFLTDANEGRELDVTDADPINRIAQPSDAWLASTEPLWDVSGSNLSNLDRTKVWLQITNLRSGYRWDAEEEAWVRGDGKFVDLLQFFANPDPDTNLASARVDLLDDALSVSPRGGSFFQPVGAPTLYALNDPFSNDSRDSVAVFDIPMTEMTRLTGDADTGPGVLDNVDERWWVDTDGDVRPDARWQTLEALGDLGGLRWVVAARIIDASGLLNYNTALEYSYAGGNLAIAQAGTANKVQGTQLDQDPHSSTGTTPADVDLFGVIYEMSGGDAANGPSNIYDTGPGTDPVRMRNDLFTFDGDPNLLGEDGIDAFEDHMYNGLGIRDFLSAADRAGDELLSGANQPAEFNEPTFFNPGGGGFGSADTWRTRAAGIPSINGFPRVPNYTQFAYPQNDQPPLLPDHTLTTGNISDGGLTTDTTDSNTPQLSTLTDSQRRAFYQLGVLPGDASPIRGLRRYPVSDLIDLRSFWGTNAEGLSEIERRIDGPQGAEGFDGGLAYLPDGGIGGDLVYGPLRSREPSLSARLNLPFDDDDLNLVRPNNEQIYYDIRRLLTPHSGAAPFSLVPLLNPAHPAFQSGALSKKPVVGRAITSSQEVTDLFSSFVWALAPQAARLSDEPASDEIVPNNWEGDRPLPYTDIPAAFAADPANPGPYYGGGVQEIDGLGLLPGPATRLAQVGFGPYTPPALGIVPPPVGASYALRTALALTANTISASRLRTTTLTPPPPIVRFYPAGESLPPGQLLPVQSTDPQLPIPTVPVYTVAGRFPFGDLPAQVSNNQLLPPFYLGAEQTGITAVGLQRQPFLVGAYSLAVYQNPVEVTANLDGETIELRVSPGVPEHRVGSILAVELANPWDSDIDLLGYEIQIHAAKFSATLQASAIRLNLDGKSIPAGQSQIFYIVTNRDEPTVADYAALMDAYRSQLNLTAAGALDANDIRIQAPDPAAEPDDGILFNRLSTDEIAEVPVLLVHRAAGLFTDAAGRRVEVLVDRMLPNFGAGGGADPIPFPSAFPTNFGEITFNFVANQAGDYNARFLRESEYRRPPKNAMRNTGNFMGGFPAYVIERPSQNEIELREDQLGIREDPSGLGNSVAQFSRLGIVPDPNLPAQPEVLQPLTTNPALRFAESFELFVPRQGILTKADVLRLTAFAHMYRPRPAGGGVDSDAVSVAEGNAGFSSFLLNGQPQNVNAGVSNSILTTPGEPYWLTVSEQLGLSANLVLTQNNTEVAINPYFHVLNPLRDHRHIATDASTLRVADALTVPPAVRIMDNIEVFESNRGVIPGRININTAPDQVQKAIPLMMPRRDIAAWLQAPFDGQNTVNSHLLSPINGGGPSGERFMEAYTDTRIETLTSYRDRFNRSSSPLPNGINDAQFSQFASVDGAFPFRRPGGQRNRQPRGILSIGEVMNMHRWVPLGTPVPAPDGSSNFYRPRSATQADAQRGFAELASNPAIPNARIPNFGSPFGTELPPAAGINYFGAPTNSTTGLGVARPADDHTERLAIFRAMSNIIETRSDVFLATFVVRGYRPSVIESIRVVDNPSDEEAAAAMNSEQFRPEYETRWLVLFDRSNVRLPTDRPRVLLKAELPPARR